MKCCAAGLLLNAVSLGAYGSLRVSDKPGEVGGWAFQNKDMHHDPSMSQPKPSVPQKLHAVPSSAAKAAQVSASADHAQLKGTSGVVKKMKGSVNKMKVHNSGNMLGSLVGDCKKNLQLDEFLPKCMSHVDDLIADIDYNYGDAQLEPTLRNFCSHAQEFPKSHGDADGFLKEVSCVEFADDLWNARVLELKTQKTSGYKDFCTKFYEHHGGRKATEKPKKDYKNPNAPAQYSAASMPSVLSVSIALSLMFGRVL
eukprot:gnl/MRDRNA2_/MRDRNA2_88407_c0_seq1.p1 gnl/MRDRNA2_/MRDRNA2_88407_c0~~gnl/MRDRNA2_/MRDRNA2_88407_c0_seq1.p1  ORF type:complete len:255 (+),score=69.07 gnl/MRDRNA2_/MRDRNA2_88407_c0_seq1:102-866(+)